MNNFEAPRWTPIREQALRGLWNTGISAADIGEKLGGLTKMAVIAKARKLGLPPVDPEVAKRLAVETRLRNRPDSIVTIRRRESEGFIWTDERVADAKKRYLAGETGASIGISYGISRSAVIGKLQRLGVVRTEGARKATPTVPREVRPKVAKVALVPRRPMEAEQQHDGSVVGLLELQAHQCRWPIGDPSDAGFGFCGEAKAYRDRPYCAHHHRVAYQPFKAHEPKDGTQLARALRRWAA